MSLIKRLSATLFARLDGVVSEIEDHEAVVQTSIDELRQRIARARARLNQMQRDEQQLADRIDRLREDTERWGERARRCAAEDEARALSCLERRRQCRREAERLQRSLDACRDGAARLTRDVEESETRLQLLHQRHTLMRARQCGTAARTAGQETGLLQEVEACFERWDTRLTERELALGDIALEDPLDEGFSRREKDEDLRAELEALLQQEKKQ